MPQSIEVHDCNKLLQLRFYPNFERKKKQKNIVFSRLDIFQCESLQLVEEQFRVLFAFDIFWQGGKLSTGPLPEACVGDCQGGLGGPESPVATSKVVGGAVSPGAVAFEAKRVDVVCLEARDAVGVCVIAAVH